MSATDDGLHLEIHYCGEWHRLQLGGPYDTLADAEDTVDALLRAGLAHRYRIVDAIKIDGHVVVSVRKEIGPT